MNIQREIKELVLGVFSFCVFLSFMFMLFAIYPYVEENLNSNENKKIFRSFYVDFLDHPKNYDNFNVGFFSIHIDKNFNKKKLSKDEIKKIEELCFIYKKNYKKIKGKNLIVKDKINVYILGEYKQKIPKNKIIESDKNKGNLLGFYWQSTNNIYINWQEKDFKINSYFGTIVFHELTHYLLSKEKISHFVKTQAFIDNEEILCNYLGIKTTNHVFKTNIFKLNKNTLFFNGLPYKKQTSVQAFAILTTDLEKDNKMLINKENNDYNSHSIFYLNVLIFFIEDTYGDSVVYNIFNIYNYNDHIKNRIDEKYIKAFNKSLKNIYPKQFQIIENESCLIFN